VNNPRGEIRTPDTEKETRDAKSQSVDRAPSDTNGADMSKRDGYDPGVLCWVDTLQPDPRAASSFYRDLFGWDFEGVEPLPGEPPGEYFVARLHGRDVAGVGPRMEDRPGAQIVNEPRAWSLSSLNTSEPETAKSFCGEVFNWEYDTFQAGQSEITLCRVPGYVGGEPEQPVPRDVVAVRTPMGGDAGPARHVRSGASSFWVDDVDGSAAKAAELGGWVVVSPFDTPTSRDAVLADPQGAVFSVSKAG
jgi:predicted enzyme related to lactoylglutathione lyase